jgi:hypothetical protein
MSKKRLQAHVGFSIVEIRKDAYGEISRVAMEFFLYFYRDITRSGSSRVLTRGL